MKKLLISLVLVFFISISTMKAYAYYEDASTDYITEEHPQVLLSQKMMTEAGKRLVPSGSILGVNDVEEVLFSYRVFVQDGLKLEVEESNILFNGQELDVVQDLFNFDYSISVLEEDSLHTNLFEGSEAGYFVEVVLRVSMETPSLEEYEMVANKAMTFEVIFQSNK